MRRELSGRLASDPWHGQSGRSYPSLVFKLFNRRLGIALIVGATTFSIIYGVAASLGVSANTLGSGTSSVTACDTDGVATSYATAYDSTVAGYEVTTVSVTGIATPGCDAKSMKVTLVGAADASLAEQTVILGTPAANETFNFASSNVLAASVLKVAVVISG